MEAMRDSWTDERLDDGFDRVTAELQSVREDLRSHRTEVRTEFAAVRSELHEGLGSFRTELRTELHEGLGSVRSELQALNRTLFLIGGGVIAALIGVIATQL